MVNVSQIRQVIQAMKPPWKRKYSRAKKPQNLIFAKTDSHADDIIHIVREVYGQGNAFARR